ncbi:MAG: hypothetical protein SFU53_15000, partial [Terrimicrobiaceae bacterium]|nr:hypothetical protein [Terrimicrobiaceae bacterium]
LPAIVGVEVPESIAPFEPVTEGYTRGMKPSLEMGADSTRIIENNLYRLVGKAGSPEDFASAVNQQLRQAIRNDFRIRRKNAFRELLAKDTTVAALYQLANDGKDPAAARKLDEVLEAQNAQEVRERYVEMELDEIEQAGR